MPHSNTRFSAEPCYDEGVLRVKTTCLKCGHWVTGNADVVVQWQDDHQCISQRKVVSASAGGGWLNIETDKTPSETVVRCSGRFLSATCELLKSAVKPLFAQGRTVVLDLTAVEYMDSSGLGTVVSLYVSAKASGSKLKLINLNKRLKELFSLTRLGEVMAEGLDNDFSIA